MGNYAQQADWLSCYHICYCTEPSAFWGDVTVPSGDSKSRWEYSNFPLSGLYLLLALSDHRSCLIMRQHLDDHRAISKHLWWPQGTRSHSARLWSLQLRVGCSWTLDGVWPEAPTQPGAVPGLLPQLTSVIILSTFLLSLSLKSVSTLPPNLHSLFPVCHWSGLVSLHQTDGGFH